MQWDKQVRALHAAVSIGLSTLCAAVATVAAWSTSSAPRAGCRCWRGDVLASHVDCDDTRSSPGQDSHWGAR